MVDIDRGALSRVEPQGKEVETSEPKRKTVAISALCEFLKKYANGSKTEEDCRVAARTHFKDKNIPDKSVWRPAWARVPSNKKLKIGKHPPADR